VHLAGLYLICSLFDYFEHSVIGFARGMPFLGDLDVYHAAAPSQTPPPSSFIQRLQRGPRLLLNPPSSAFVFPIASGVHTTDWKSTLHCHILASDTFFQPIQTTPTSPPEPSLPV